MYTNTIEESQINLARVNYLLSIGLNKDRLNRRLWRAKSTGNFEEYLTLSMVKARMVMDTV